MRLVNLYLKRKYVIALVGYFVQWWAIVYTMVGMGGVQLKLYNMDILFDCELSARKFGGIF